MRFRKAEKNEAGEILALYKSVVGKKFCTWDEYYPGEDTIEQDMASGGLYVLEDAGKIIGAISIVSENEMDDCECWQTRDNAAEFARVVIAPKRQGEGLSKLLVEGVLREFEKRGTRSVHISVAKQNIPARKLYEGLGFMDRGEKEMYDNEYYLCEKPLEKRGKRKKHKWFGRRLHRMGALLLLASAAYELYVRLDDCRAWLQGVRHLSEKLDMPFGEILSIIMEAPAMRELGMTMLFLLCGVLFAFVAIGFCNRPKAGFFVFVLDAALAFFGVAAGVYTLSPTGLLQWLKLLPMLMIAAGCFVNIGAYFMHKRKKKNMKISDSVQK